MKPSTMNSTPVMRYEIHTVVPWSVRVIRDNTVWQSRVKRMTASGVAVALESDAGFRKLADETGPGMPGIEAEGQEPG